MTLGHTLRNIGSFGRFGRKLDKKQKAERERAEALAAENTQLAQQMFDRDYGQSALANLAADPLDVLAQRQTMAQYGTIANQGYTDTDRRALDQAFRQSQREEQSQRGAVMDAAARRGDVSGGVGLMGALAAQQGGADRASEFGTNVALEGRRRAMEALAAQGSMAGQMRNQGVSEQAQRGGALDAFNSWRTGQQSQDAGMLMNARSGQAQNYQANADRLAQQRQAMSDQTGQIVGGVVQGALQMKQGGGSTPAGSQFGTGSLPAGAGTGGGAPGQRWNPATQRWE